MTTLLLGVPEKLSVGVNAPAVQAASARGVVTS